MATLALALLMLFLLHQATEGTLRFRWSAGPPVLAAVQVGQVRIVVCRYRPHRIYFRVSYTPGFALSGGVR